MDARAPDEPAPDEPLPDFAPPWRRWIASRVASPSCHWLTRFVLLRLLGGVYLVAFLTAVLQGIPLLGRGGITPMASYMADLREHYDGSTWQAFLHHPTLFWLVGSSDRAILALGWTGVLLSVALVLGFGNAFTLAALWALHMSFVHVGQLWYGFGWEIQLLETGFLAIFFVPVLDPRPFPRTPPPDVIVWLYRWLACRIMLGAGLIKLRGDPCWRQLTCLDWHYETQPLPNPLSPYWHFLPSWMHRFGVVYNHVAELVCPLLFFAPRRVRHVAASVVVVFQLCLILSGNLSYLNYLTLVPVVACFDDVALARLLPRRALSRTREACAPLRTTRSQRAIAGALFVLVALLSIEPVLNLVSRRQRMNTSFDRLALVNTYGAFGSVGRVRNELVIEGTRDATVTPGTVWVPYEFKCKPGDPDRRPCVVSPYHLRLDWLAWFAAMGTLEDHPWVARLVWLLLHNDRGALSLLAGNPFPGRPPSFVRVRYYRYRFAPLGSHATWTRQLLGEWMRPVSVDDDDLRALLEAYGWPVDDPITRPGAGAR